MKTQSFRIAATLISLTIIILLWVGPAHSSEFPSSLAYFSEDSVLALNQEKIDSLTIVKIGEKYYVFCSVCPITADDGFLQKKIIDTINYIDPAIPEQYWVEAYVTKSFVYKSRPNMSNLLLEKGQLVIKNSRDEYYAILTDKGLVSLTLMNVQKNSASNAINSGRAGILCLIGFGLLLGLLIFRLKRVITKIATFILVSNLVFLFLKFMFTPTNEALYFTMGAFIVGIIFMFIAMLTANSISKKNRTSKK